MSNRTRVTGMYSGMDTESLIQQLVEARRTKVTKETKNQSRITYQQEAWTDLNKKLKDLKGKFDNLRYSSAYSKMTTEVSDSSVASVVTSDGAMTAVQSLEVTKLAKAGYMTGAEIKKPGSSDKLTSGTKLSELGIEAGSKFNIEVGGKNTEITITEGMTLGGLAKKLSGAGVTANFDASTQRFFIGSKDTGEKYDFSLTASDDSGKKALAALGLSEEAYGNYEKATKIDGQDAEIKLNNAVYKSSSNSFNINGLTITAKAETNGRSVSLNTTKDTSAIYDMVKDVIKSYSELINEMDKLYNADTKTKYDPLTDEEKSAMSEYEIEKWEEKMKEQLLSKDATLGNLTSSFTAIMNQGFTVGGKTMHLFDFGIETAGYFNAPDNEKNALHILGDEDDTLFGTETNKLKQAIAADPDAITNFFSQLSDAMYQKMTDLSSRVPGYRSYGSFFEDTRMKSEYDDYKTKIEDMEQKLSDYEDKWYDKFAKMEKAMAKMQSNQNAVSGMFGMN
ncbi:MAG: flagellar filament capping protein FliD [Lachnospiraceae bacterium]|nr:flagellar filament capping protein FliD [Lachnospiraceae bacterium]